LNEIILSPKVLTVIFIDIFLFLWQFYAFINALVFIKKYKKDFSQTQYKLEKKSYFISTVISLSIYIKFFSLIFFIYVLDDLSLLLKGAMCAAGVIDSNNYGEIVLALKILNIFLAFLWIDLHKKDELTKNYKYIKIKMVLFSFLFLLFLAEVYTEVMFFLHIEIFSPLQCCVILFKGEENSFLHFFKSINILYIFFINLTIIFMLLYKKSKTVFFFSILHVYISYYAITYFFSSYIYMLPSHKCPFCLLQWDYKYIGYIIYLFLFLATLNIFRFVLFDLVERVKFIYIYYICFTIFLSFSFFKYIFLFNHFL